MTTKQLIEKRCKNEVVKGHLIHLVDAEEAFKERWMVKSANKTNEDLFQLGLKFDDILEVQCPIPDKEAEGMKIYKMFYTLEKLQEKEIRKALRLPKDISEEEKKELTEKRENAISSWNWLQGKFDPKAFKEKFGDSCEKIYPLFYETYHY